MRFAEVIKLLSVTIGQDDYGDPVETITESEVYANKKSASSTEFYSALTSGIDISVVFEIRAEDYNGEKQIKHNDKLYNVIRTSQKGEGFVNLICSDKAV